MKEIVITNKAGITLHTKKSLVDDDIKIKLSDDLFIKGIEASNNDTEIRITEPKSALYVDADIDYIGLEHNAYVVIDSEDGNSEVEIDRNSGKVIADNLTPENIVKGVNILGVVGTYEGGSSGNTLKNLLDNTKSAQYLFYRYKADNISDLIQYNDTENVTNFSYIFGNTNTNSIPILNTKKGTTFNNAFTNAQTTVIPAWDVRSATSMSSIFQSCSNVVSILMYGMQKGFMITHCSKLESEALVTIFSNCQVVTSTQTIQMGSDLQAKLDGVYVKETGVEQYEGITCRPCVICESTDSGAMLATDYITGKGWTLT